MPQHNPRTGILWERDWAERQRLKPERRENESKPKLSEVGRGELIVIDLSIIQDGNAAALNKERYV
jgi:hypothetical protein